MAVKSVILAGVKSCLGQSRAMVWDELHQSGVDSLKRGDYSSAERYLLKAVAESSAAKEDQANLATSLLSLGEVYGHLQDYAKAEAALTRALSIRGKVLGMEHPDVARVIDELGLVYFNQQNFAQAEPLLRRGLDMRKKLLGERHPDVADSMVSVASFCEARKKSQEAEMLLQNALSIQEETIGRDDIRLAPTLGLLAVHRFNKKDFRQAEELGRRALAIRELALGADHPDVAMSLHVLAMISLAQHDFQKAETSYRRALTIRERYLPPNHSGIASILKHLGVSYYCQDKYAEAEEIYFQLDAISESAGNTADMLVAWRQRSWIRLREKRLADCENYTQMCLQRMKERDIDDKDTRDSLILSLFSCYVAQKNYLMAAKTLPGTAFAVGKRFLNGNNPFKKSKTSSRRAKMTKKLARK